MFYIATFCLLYLNKIRDIAGTVKTSKKGNVHKQEKERHKKVEIRKIEQQWQKQIN